MPRIILLVGCLLVLSGLSPALAASDKAARLREANSLAPFTPPPTLLAGCFLADEMDPAFLFGTVGEFASSRKCPVTWLIEEGEKARIGKPQPAGKPLEYTLYLEEDCPDGVNYYVFVDQSAMTPKQWIEWRRQFHKNKAEGEYGAARDRLEKAVAEGVKMGGELRFIMRDGELSCAKTPEAALSQDLAFRPVYDLKSGARLSK